MARGKCLTEVSLEQLVELTGGKAIIPVQRKWLEALLTQKAVAEFKKNTDEVKEEIKQEEAEESPAAIAADEFDFNEESPDDAQPLVVMGSGV